MKSIHFTKHSLIQCVERGTNKEEIIEAIRTGSKEPAKLNRTMFTSNFAYNNFWNKTFYAIKQVSAVVSIEEKEIIVITIYTYYF